MAPSSPNSALLLGVGCSAEAQRARIAAAVEVLEEKKAAALAAERYEDCAKLRDALAPLRAQGSDGALAPPGEVALRDALCGADAPAPAVGATSLHPQLSCTAWRADNRYFSAEVDLLALPVQDPPAWEEACTAVLSEPGPVGASKHRCQALVALVENGTNPDSLTALTALAQEPEVLLLCELSPTPALASSKSTSASPEAAEARTERLARLESGEGNDEGPLWEWSVEHGFEYVILPWHVAVGVPTALLDAPKRPAASAADAAQEQEEGQQGLARVVEALQNTMWGTLVMKPRPELDDGPATSTTREAPAGEKEACTPAGNSALVVSFVAALPDIDDVDGNDDTTSTEPSMAAASGTISSASIAAALGLGSEYGSVPAMATWRVHNRYFTADVAMCFVDAAAQPAAALAAARDALAEQSPSQAGRATGSALASSAMVSRCGAVILILSEEMGKNPAASALLSEWSDLIAQFPYQDGCNGPEMLALCVNVDAAPYAPAIEWCADHGFELVRPPANLQQEHSCADSSCGSQDFGDEEGLSRSTDKEGVWRLVEALKQNVWGTVRMHEQAAPAPRPQSDGSSSDAPTASSINSGGSADANGVAPQLEHLLLSSTADDEASAAGGGSSQQTMASMEEMFREVSSFKAASSNMSREQRHAAAERIAMSFGLLGELDGDEYDSADEAVELEKFLGDDAEHSGGD
eukprot:COSAG02_NODE_207_length_29119_cov_41.071365_13_plen_699_part_00